jgi:hemoglobin
VNATPFELLGGEAAVRQLVDRFYDLMDLEPAYAGLRALHPETLDGSRDKLHWFLCGWLGGPQLYVAKFGHPRLRARHLPYSIGIAERDQWMACMKQAMRESSVDESMSERLAESFFGTADWMRNKGA